MAALAETGLLQFQSLARGMLARERIKALKRGRAAAMQDEGNRMTLRKWVEAQAKKDPKRRAAFEVKAAKKFAESQRKRCRVAAKAGAKVGATLAVRPWLPTGVDVRYSSTRGRYLVATRSFSSGDIVLAEGLAVRATVPFSRKIDLSSEEESANWLSMVRAVASMKDSLSRARVLFSMYREDPSPLLAMKLADFTKKAEIFLRKSASGEGLLQRELARASLTKSIQELSAIEAARRIPLVFRANAFESAGTDNSTQVACLSILGSLLNHSCDANCLRVYDSSASFVEYVAARAIVAGEALTVDYLGTESLLWPRDKRRDHLLATKGFECDCVRCDLGRRPDRERCLACPFCLPIEQRDNGGFCVPCMPLELPPLAAGSQTPFALPVDDESLELSEYRTESMAAAIVAEPDPDALAERGVAGEERDGVKVAWNHAKWSFGYLSFQKNNGYSPASEAAAVWRCSRHPTSHKCTTDDLVAMRLPDGGPAKNYFALLEYCDKLGNDLDSATDEILLASSSEGGGAEVHVTAVTSTIGRRHWAAKVRSLRRLRSMVDANQLLYQNQLRRGLVKLPDSGSVEGLLTPEGVTAAATHLERLVMGLIGFARDWLGLDPVRAIGPVPLLRAADALLAARHTPAAEAIFSVVVNFTPPFFGSLYTASNAGLAKCRES